MGELYLGYFDRVYDFVHRLVRDSDEAADIVQDVFLKAMSALPTLKKRERFRSWLFTIAHNASLNRIEQRRHIVRTKSGGDGESSEAVIYDRVDTDRLADPQAALADKEIAALVWEAAAGLDSRQYSLLDLHVRQGLESAEIADVLGVSKGNAYTMLSRLKSAVQETVEAYVMMRLGRGECSVLDSLLPEHGTSGMTPELRRLVSNHVADCDTCLERKKRLVSPFALLAAFTPVMPPTGLEKAIGDQVLDGSEPAQLEATANTPEGAREGWGDRLGRAVGIRRSNRRLRLLILGGAIGGGAALVVGLLALFGVFSGGEERLLGFTLASPMPPGATASNESASPTLEPARSQQAHEPTSTSNIAAPTVSPSADEEPVVSRDPLEPPVPTPPPTSPPRAPDTAGPQITALSATPAEIWEDVPSLCTNAPKTSSLSAQVADPSGVSLVTLSWTLGQVTGTRPMTRSGTTATAELGPFDENALPTSESAKVTIVVTAHDSVGNLSRSQTTITLHDCSFF